MHWVDCICRDYNIGINELSRLTGISPGTLGSAKSRRTSLSDIKYSNIVKLAHKLNTTPQFLIVKYDN